jgi:hypothetical protein
VKSEERRRGSRRDRRSPSGRRPWQFSLFALFVATTFCAVLLSVGKTYPLETLIVLAIIAFALLGVALFVGELVIIGWIMDLFSWMSMLGLHAKEAPLEYQQVGEMIVVKLSDNIVSVRQCRSVQKQLQRLVDERHCDFILDFSCIGKISSRFHGVMTGLSRAARREAGRQARPYRPVALPPGELFRIFDDRQSAVEEMAGHDGHGWVVLCCVPAGIRAVSGASLRDKIWGL